MPSADQRRTRYFRVEAKIGKSNANTVTVAPGSVTHHVVIVRLWRGTETATKLFCEKLSGTAAEYHPAPPDAWEHDFPDPIGAFTEVSKCTAAREVHAGLMPGKVILQVKELLVDDRGPGKLPYDVSLEVDFNVG